MPVLDRGVKYFCFSVIFFLHEWGARAYTMRAPLGEIRRLRRPFVTGREPEEKTLSQGGGKS